MTYFTLAYNGMELSLADWGAKAGGAFKSWKYDWANQLTDRLTCVIAQPFTSAQLIPFNGTVTFRMGRTPAQGAATTANGAPIAGCTAWQGGLTLFTGWRVKPKGRANARSQSVNYQFDGVWNRFGDCTKFQKTYLSYNGSSLIANYIDQFTLGVSLQSFSGESDTIPGTIATNYMSIPQQIREILAFLAYSSALTQQAGLLPGSTAYAGIAATYIPGSVTGTPGVHAGAQFQFDQNSLDGATGDFLLAAGPGSSSANVLIPDFAPGYGTVAASRNGAATGTQILRAPNNAVNNITCSDAMREMLKWIGGLGGVSCWLDYSVTPPRIRIATKDQLPAQSLALTPPQVSGLTSQVSLAADIALRDDLMPNAVHFKYLVSGSNVGNAYQTIYHDIAFYSAPDNAIIEGVGKWGALTNLAGATWDGPHQTAFQNAALLVDVVGGTFDYIGTSTFGLIGKINSASAALIGTASWWENVCPKLATAGSLAFANSNLATFTVIDPGTSGLPAGLSGTTGLSTILGDLYSALGLSGSDTMYYLLPGSCGVAPWMRVGDINASGGISDAGQDGAPASYVTVQLRFEVSYGEAMTAAGGGAGVPTAQKTEELPVTLILTNLASRSYHCVTAVDQGEPIPFGYAGYVMNLQSIPQYEGSITIASLDFANFIPPGHNLNITGGSADWATMNAQMQSLSLEGDANSCHATYNFGPPKHMGFADLNELIRVNHGPRWDGLFANTPLNQANTGATGGQNLPTSAPAGTGAGGMAAFSNLFLPNDIGDWNTNGASYPVPPGVTHYTPDSVLPNATVLTGAVFSGPGWALGGDSSGSNTQNRIICDWAQFLSLKPATLTGPASPPAGWTSGKWQAGWVEMAIGFDNGSGLECTGWFVTVFSTLPYKKS